MVSDERQALLDRRGDGANGDGTSVGATWRRWRMGSRAALVSTLSVFGVACVCVSAFAGWPGASGDWPGSGATDRKETSARDGAGVSELGSVKGVGDVWIVAGTYPGARLENERLFESCNMFWNENLYAKLVFYLDFSEPGASEHAAWIKSQYPYPFVVDVSDMLSSEERESFRAGMHKAGTGYDKQQYLKMNLDRIVDLAVGQNSGASKPTVVGLIDDDTYFQTYPVTSSVVSDDGRLIVHGLSPSFRRFYIPATTRLFGHAPLVNFMVAFPAFAHLSLFPAMRAKASEVANGLPFYAAARKAFQKDMQSEMCIIWNYAALFDRDRYFFSINPAYGALKEFSDSHPVARTMIHDHVRSQRSQKGLVKGCCLTYNLHDEFSFCPTDAAAHVELTAEDPWGERLVYGGRDTADKHYAAVHAELNRASEARREMGRDACVAHLTKYCSGDDGRRCLRRGVVGKNRRRHHVIG